MSKYVCLLRGINVGGKNKVEMTKLKMAFETMGFTKVSTYINSGNVLFSGSKPSAKKIEQSLTKAFGFAIPVVLRTAKNIIELNQFLPTEWQNDGVQKTDILFLWDSYDSAESIQKIKVRSGVDILRYFPGTIVWHIDPGLYTKSYMRYFIGTDVYKHMTARNINTVRKLAELLQA